MKKRSYGQSCAVARGTDLLGDRWTLLVIRDLLIAPRRFSELEARLKGMGTNLLTERLRTLIHSGLVAAPGPDRHYALTAQGRALEPLILEMVRWTLTWLGPGDASQGLHVPDWDLLALKALFRPDVDRVKPLLARFDADGWIAWVSIDSATCRYGLGAPPAPADISFPCFISALQRRGEVVGKLPLNVQPLAAAFVSAFEAGPEKVPATGY